MGSQYRANFPARSKADSQASGCQEADAGGQAASSLDLVALGSVSYSRMQALADNSPIGAF